MIAQFRQKSPANIILLLIFGMLIKMPMFFFTKNIEAAPQDGKLYHYFLSLFQLKGNNGFLAAFISFLLLYIQALMINFLVNDQRMTNKQTFLPAMSYLLITSLRPEWNMLSAPLIASTLIIWGFIRLFKLYNREFANSAIYNLGLITGVSSFVYFPSAIFVFCFLFGLAILRPFRFNDLILHLMGILTPYYFFTVYLFFAGKLTVASLVPGITVQIPSFPVTAWLVITIILLVVPFLRGGYYIQVFIRKMLIQVRKNWGMLLFYLLLAILVPFVNTVTPSHNWHNWMLALAPLAAFHTGAYLYPQRLRIPVIIFLATVAFVLVQQYGSPVWK